MSFKKVMIVILFSTLGIACHAQNMDLENIRANYKKAVSDKKLCQTLLKELHNSSDSSVRLTYLGAFQTIWAKHITNPFSKLKTFNRGKRNIDEAVIAQPNNVEIRFVRLSVQKNSPSFLGYKNNMEEDKKFIQANKKNIKSAVLKKMIAALL